jgi:hypothetical protein
MVAPRWWLKPIILATQETKIRRTDVRSQTEQIVHKTNPSQKTHFEKTHPKKELAE